MGWYDCLQQALDYIEDHLTDELSIEDVAAQAYLSPFHFQHVFSALCGMPLGEYIRCRRLTLAAQELSRGDARVLDVALRYHYDSPDGFSRAFCRFHGVKPSQARLRGVTLSAMTPLKIHVNLEGGTMMDYRIVDKPDLTLVGVSRTMNPETSYRDIPRFWQEHMTSSLKDRIAGTYGVCLDSTRHHFQYLIADDAIPGQGVPEGCVIETIPSGTWAVFPCRGALPQALQQVNTRIWKEWMPTCTEYRLGGNYNIEKYTLDGTNDESTYSEIWVPLIKG